MQTPNNNKFILLKLTHKQYNPTLNYQKWCKQRFQDNPTLNKALIKSLLFNSDVLNCNGANIGAD